MKKLVLAVSCVLIGAVLGTAVPAGAHHSMSYDRLASRLQRLENAVSFMDDRVAGVEETLYDCLFVQGVTSFGDPEFGEGFWYGDPLGDFLTTGLDFDDSGRPHAWMLIADESCVGEGSRKEHTLRRGEVGTNARRRN